MQVAVGPLYMHMRMIYVLYTCVYMQVALGPLCWEIITSRDLVDPDVISVDDEMLRDALRISLAEMKQV